MAHGNEPDERDPKFSFGTRELREAKRAPLKPDEPLRRAAPAVQGFDPYNTSGSFDCRKHWERVGRR